MKMKKLCISLSLLLVFVCFVACTADTPSASTDSTPQTEAPTVADTTPQEEATEAASETEPTTEPTTEAATEDITETTTEAVTEDITETTTEAATDTPRLSADFTTDLYSVEKIDGVCYLNFHDGNQASTTDGNLDCMVIGTYFDSFAELRNAFLKGELTENTVAAIKQQFKQAENGIVVLDIVNMGQPTFPADCKTKQLCWTGQSISIPVESSQYGSSGTFFIETDAAYEEFYSLYYADTAGEGATVVETASTYDGVPCTIYDVTNGAGRFREVKIEISRGTQTFHICLKYILEHKQNLWPTSEEHPYSASVFSESNGQKYFLQQYALNGTPTVDWLTSFVLEPVSE